ncbi:MAG: hypothetical protein ACMUJM_21990 [bacterium]
MGVRVRAISLAIGIMISPVSLIVLGNNIGMWGVTFLVGIILAMVAQNILPRFLMRSENPTLLPLIALAGGIAVMMGLGMAGKPDLDIYIRACMLFWLLNYAVVHLCALINRKSIVERSQTLQVSGFPVSSVIGLLVILTGFFVLLGTDGQYLHLITSMLIIAVPIILVGIVRFWLSPLLSRGR